MPYTTPTYEDFIARFPIFDNVVLYPQPVVEALLTESANTIDESWREVDYQPAIMYLTAHKLSTDNSAEGDVPDVGGPTTIASESFSGMSVSYKTALPQAGSAAASPSYGTTEYGRRYYNLLKANKPAVVVA